MSFEKLLPCPFCGGEPEEDGGTFVEYYGHERQDYLITCKQCGAEVYCSVGTFERADVPCSCHHDTRKVCVDKWNKRAAIIQAANSPAIPDAARDALERALAAMEFMGDTLNNLDAVCSEDVEFVTPAFDAVRRVLAAAPQEVR